MVIRYELQAECDGARAGLLHMYDGQGLLPDPDRSSVQRETLFSVTKGVPFVVYGFGWGHGLGMSQYGAYQMALSNKGIKNYYRQILSHYYTGTRIEQLY